MQLFARNFACSTPETEFDPMCWQVVMRGVCTDGVKCSLWFTKLASFYLECQGYDTLIHGELSSLYESDAIQANNKFSYNIQKQNAENPIENLEYSVIGDPRATSFITRDFPLNKFVSYMTESPSGETKHPFVLYKYQQGFIGLLYKPDSVSDSDHYFIFGKSTDCHINGTFIGHIEYGNFVGIYLTEIDMKLKFIFESSNKTKHFSFIDEMH
jgi:hypothetical protein